MNKELEHFGKDTLIKDSDGKSVMVGDVVKYDFGHKVVESARDLPESENESWGMGESPTFTRFEYKTLGSYKKFKTEELREMGIRNYSTNKLPFPSYNEPVYHVNIDGFEATVEETFWHNEKHLNILIKCGLAFATIEEAKKRLREILDE